MVSDILEIMKETAGAMGVQALYLTPPYEDAQELDFGLRGKLFSGFRYPSMAQEIAAGCIPDTIYLSKDDFCMYHTIFLLPDQIKKEQGFTLCILGPMLFQELNRQDFSLIVESHRLENKLANDLLVFYSQIPRFASLDHWNNLILCFCRRLFQKEPHIIQSHDPSNSLFPLNFTGLLQQPQLNSPLSMETIEKRYAAENALLQAVRAGNEAQALLRHSQFAQYRIAPRTSDSLRNNKNLAIVLSTLCRKAAEQAGVHPIYIDELSRTLSIQIEACTNQVQLRRQMDDIVRRYCGLTASFSRSRYSPLVQRCMDYINFCYAERLSLSLLAGRLGASESYLSALFKKETGINLNAYIQETRLRQALILLNSTRLPVKEIAGQCGFLDENYFARVFKKHFEISPREYRKRISGE